MGQFRSLAVGPEVFDANLAWRCPPLTEAAATLPAHLCVSDCASDRSAPNVTRHLGRRPDAVVIMGKQ